MPPTLICPDVNTKVDDYDILQDVKEQKANVTIGQLLHDNPNYQKQIKAPLIKPRKRKVILPPVAVNFAELEDFGAPEISVEIDGCIIRNVPVDGGSGVNLLLESTIWITTGAIPIVPSGSLGTIHSWADVRMGPEVAKTEPIKTVVSPDDYEEVKVAEGKFFFLGKQLSD
ncbi:hypothetical protein AXG93_4293s1030 [Marchantia polymorpha subsp. ruderalis]|uniref:Uncharacterized protein n=1 Tax=Marchantia polymorpha subsp. ruderalis TaxID=1480154 RepID=A0A176WIY9_MARPO|nr:hypothetical protein AXG93_4293s1030 [Marchantia polymorpha subsp. ruderalis]